MFERFTDRSRRVVVLAQEEARLLGHNYIGTEHLLLGLVHEAEGVGARALQELDVDLDSVRAAVEKIIGAGRKAPSGHIPFTPRAKVVLELSLREALRLGHNYIGTEHILLGLLREGEGVGAQVLQRLGAELHVARHTVISLLAGVDPSEVPAPPVEMGPLPPAERFVGEIRHAGFVGSSSWGPAGVAGVLTLLFALVVSLVERPLGDWARYGLVVLGLGVAGVVIAAVEEMLRVRASSRRRQVAAWWLAISGVLLGLGALALLADALIS